jgi:phage gp16-like protein
MTAQTTQQHQAAQAAFAEAQEVERQRLIKLLQVARRDRRWSDDDWAHIKREYGGAESLTDMDVPELEAVLAHARACGFRPTHTRADGQHSRPLDQSRQARLIRAVWLRMGELGIVRHADESALGSWLANHRNGKVVTDLALMAQDELDRSINRVRAFACREIGGGTLQCPHCGLSFRPNPRQAWAFVQDLIRCDQHSPAVPYQWRRDPMGGRTPKAHVRHERPA